MSDEIFSGPWKIFVLVFVETARLKFRQLSMIGAICFAWLSAMPSELMLIVKIEL